MKIENLRIVKDRKKGDQVRWVIDGEDFETPLVDLVGWYLERTYVGMNIRPKWVHFKRSLGNYHLRIRTNKDLKYSTAYLKLGLLGMVEYYISHRLED